MAIGYKLGDLTQYMSWRILFYIEAGVAVPVVLFCLLAPAVRLRGKLTQVQPEGELAHSSLCKALMKCSQKAYVLDYMHVWLSPAPPRNTPVICMKDALSEHLRWSYCSGGL